MTSKQYKYQPVYVLSVRRDGEDERGGFRFTVLYRYERTPVSIHPYTYPVNAKDELDALKKFKELAEGTNKDLYQVIMGEPDGGA